MVDTSKYTVSIERLDAHAASTYADWVTEGTLGIVVRYEGRFVKVAEVRDEIPPGITMEKAARAIADGYGARYEGERPPGD